MPSGFTTIIIPVKDVAGAKEIYTKLLGAAPVMDSPYYVGFRVGTQDVGLLPNGHQMGMNGPVCYVDVDDIKSTLEQLTGVGAEIQQGARDVGGGLLVATLKDADGNVFGLRQAPKSASG